MLINEHEYFNLENLNAIINSFSYGTSTKPNTISDKELISEAKFNQSGKVQDNNTLIFFV